MKKAFRPEFLNRIDDIIVFSQLSETHIEKIAALLCKQVVSRMEALGITLSFSEEAISHIAKAGFDETYGARPLKRAIQSKVEDKIAEILLKDPEKKNIAVSEENSQLIFN